MQRILLLFIFQHARIRLTEHRFVELVTKTLASLVHLFLHLLVILGELLLDEHVGTIALLRIAVVNQRVVEGIHMPARLPNGGVHEDGGIDAHNILIEQHH